MTVIITTLVNALIIPVISFTILLKSYFIVRQVFQLQQNDTRRHHNHSLRYYNFYYIITISTTSLLSLLIPISIVIIIVIFHFVFVFFYIKNIIVFMITINVFSR